MGYRTSTLILIQTIKLLVFITNIPRDSGKLLGIAGNYSRRLAYLVP